MFDSGSLRELLEHVLICKAYKSILSKKKKKSILLFSPGNKKENDRRVQGA